jgi:1-deoxy-D-xylulose-5-phosphate synthase
LFGNIIIVESKTIMEANLNNIDISENDEYITERLARTDILSRIANPDDLKKLHMDYVPSLCDEIRQFLRESVTTTGGHLGSNLGVVEVTTALHYVFDFLKDVLIFDVSHQCYIHKLLTGRKTRFNTLRKLNGLSGFTNKDESEYDHFTFGHAGTAISVGLGMAEAFKSDNQERNVVVVVGDASISAGMSLEALNHLGQTEEDVLIILNDNNMSIAPTVGSLSKYLTKTRTYQPYLSMKEKVASILRKIPGIGNFLYKLVFNIKDDIKHALMPRNMFSDLSIPYYGPIDGHDVVNLIETVSALKSKKGPKLLHVYTEKGKGMPNLEAEPTRFHSAPSFSSKPSDRGSYTSTFANTLLRLGKKHANLVAITAAMPDGTGLVKFKEVFPERFYDVGICEQHAIGMASGLSTGGKLPVCAIYSSFLQRAYDQVFHEVCLQRLPMVIALDRAGLVGSDGPTHHGVFDIAFLRTLPNIILCSPRDGFELDCMMEYLTEKKLTSAIRYPKADTIKPNLADERSYQPIELGKAEVISESDDASLTIMAYGSMVEPSVRAVRQLEQKGIRINLINMRFVKPIDEQVIRRFADKGKPIITIEEHSRMGGFGSAVLEVLSEIGSAVKVKVMAIPDSFIEHGSRDELLKMVGLDSEAVVRNALSLLNVKSGL